MILKFTNESIPVIDGLIMIDCWQPSIDQKTNYNGFYLPLLSTLIKFDFKCIVNVAYNVALNTEDISIKNAFRTYYWPDSPYGQNHNIVQNLVKHCGGENQTSLLFKEALIRDTNSIMLLQFEDFVYHWQHVLDCKVNNWLVVGQTWQNCVHHRPIGLEIMYRNIDHSKLNFYAIDNGFKLDDGSPATHEDFANDSLPWIHIPNFGYKLVSRSSGHWTGAMDFYRDFMNGSRIAIEIHCTVDVAPLIPKSDEIFDVTVVYEPNEAWQFSYSKFAGAYQLDETDLQKNIKVWVFDISQPFTLETLLSYTNPLSSSFMTEDKKIVIFETNRITSTHVIANFVK